MTDHSIKSKRTARITKKVQLEELQMVVVCACSPLQGRHGRMLVIVSPRCEPKIAAVEKSYLARRKALNITLRGPRWYALGSQCKGLMVVCFFL